MSKTSLVGLLLLISGTCSLLFQTTWFREFRLIFGASTLASSAVLAIFMGGLGLGNALLGRMADRTTSPLKLYARLELAISVWCACTPVLVIAVRWVYLAAGGQETLGVTGATIFRLFGTALVIGTPTFLMGGTLPAAVKAITSADDWGRRSVGLLYGLNTIGAVIGCLLGTFVLFEWFGTRTTLWIACAVNFVNAVVAWTLASNFRFHQMVVPQELHSPASPSHANEPFVRDWPASAYYASAAIVGAAFFLMEMVWYRMLSPILGGSTFTFGLILAVALSGIGIGGAIYSWIFRHRAPTLGSFVHTLAWEALAIAVPFALGDFIAVLALNLRNFAIYGFWGQASGWIIIAAIVVFPASVIAGVQFPILIALVGRGNHNVGRQLGQAFAWNTVGSMAGSLAGGFGLMTMLTAPGVWKAVVVGLLVWALVLSTRLLSRMHAVSLGQAALISLLAFFCLSAKGPTAVWRHSGIGAGRASDIGSSQIEFKEWINANRRHVIWEADGRESAVAITGSDSLSFLVNGKSDGNAISDAGTQIMLGVIGALQHPEPTSAFIVGLGTGESAGWLASLPSIQSVDVVELEPAVIEMARMCAPLNHDVMRHPKVNVVINDAREQLQTTRKTYDLIASEPSNPYRSGISSLYTKEFYESAAVRLAPGGIFSQWLQAYETDVDTILTVLATLHQVFPYVEIWQTRPGDMVLTCSKEPLQYRREDLDRKLQIPEYAQATLVAWQTTQTEGVMSHLMAGNKFVLHCLNPFISINTDDWNHLEFGFARTVGRTNNFLVSDIAKQAEQSEIRWPERLRSDLNLSRIADLQVASDLLSGNNIQLTTQNSERAAVWKAIEMDEQANALRIWSSMQPELKLTELDFSEMMLLATAMAKVRDSGLPELLEVLSRQSSGNALAAATMLAIHQDNPEITASRLAELFVYARTDPTIVPMLLITSLISAEKLALENPQYAAPLFESLRQPFSLKLAEQQRLVVLLNISLQLPASATANTLEEIEPYPIWSELWISQRHRVYQETGGRYREAAFRDFKQLQRLVPQTMLLRPTGPTIESESIKP